jgi:hypothetical protein
MAASGSKWLVFGMTPNAEFQFHESGAGNSGSKYFCRLSKEGSKTSQKPEHFFVELSHPL